MVQFQGSQIYPSVYVQSQCRLIIYLVTIWAPLLHLHLLAH